jgi:hypothetical protein
MPTGLVSTLKEIECLPKAKTQVAEAEAVEVSRLDMLEAFSELVGERYGYWMARP